MLVSVRALFFPELTQFVELAQQNRKKGKIMFYFRTFPFHFLIKENEKVVKFLKSIIFLQKGK